MPCSFFILVRKPKRLRVGARNILLVIANRELQWGFKRFPPWFETVRKPDTVLGFVAYRLDRERYVFGYGVWWDGNRQASILARQRAASGTDFLCYSLALGRANFRSGKNNLICFAGKQAAASRAGHDQAHHYYLDLGQHVTPPIVSNRLLRHL